MFLKLTIILSQVLVQFQSHGLVPLTLEFLSAEQNTRIVFHTLEAIFSICLLGNIVHLTQLEEETSQKELLFPQFVVPYLYKFHLPHQCAGQTNSIKVTTSATFAVPCMPITGTLPTLCSIETVELDAVAPDPGLVLYQR